jgi:leucyl-tRNA synthetase
VHKFLRKLWRLFFGSDGILYLSDEDPSTEERKVLHRTIKKISDDIERFSFNTAVSTFMICVNDLTDLKCRKREILEPLLILIAPFAPHLAEELWNIIGHQKSISGERWPLLDPAYLVDEMIEYPVSFNGKMRFKLELAADLDNRAIEDAVMGHELTVKYLQGMPVKKVVIVPKRIINLVF